MRERRLAGRRAGVTGRRPAAASRRRLAMLALVLAVIGLHLGLGAALAPWLAALADPGAMPERLQAMFVRDLLPTTPPPGMAPPAAPPAAPALAPAAAPEPPASQPRASTERPRRKPAAKAAPKKEPQAVEPLAAPRPSPTMAEASVASAAASAPPPEDAAASAAEREAAASAVISPAVPSETGAGPADTPPAAAAASAAPLTSPPGAASDAAPSAPATTSATTSAAGAGAAASAQAASARASETGTAAPFEWPASTRLSYDMVGNYRGEVRGSAQVEWVHRDARYQVHLDVIAGLSFAPLFTRRITSDGVIGPDGLEPRRYDEETKRAFAERRRLTVQLDPGQIVYGNGQRLPRPPGVQDSASQFVQLLWLFTLQPQRLQPGQAIALPLALPRGLDQWVYEVQPAETVYLPFGALQAVPLKPRREARPGDLTVEMWIAPTLQYLPVRIRIHQDASTFIDLMLSRPPQQAAQR